MGSSPPVPTVESALSHIRRSLRSLSTVDAPYRHPPIDHKTATLTTKNRNHQITRFSQSPKIPTPPKSLDSGKFGPALDLYRGARR